MRFGCCGCVVYGRSPDNEDRIITGIEALPVMEKIGFHYIELSLSDTMRLDEPGFLSVIQRLENSRLKCEVCHNFIPSNIRLTGHNVDAIRALEYVREAFQRAARLGAEIIVFGSAGARNIPFGFSRRTAEKQIVDFLHRVGDMAEEHELMVVVEPVNRGESNIINTLSEALLFCHEVNHPRIKAIYDLYHMINEKEDSNIIHEAGEDLKHVHISEPKNRGFPVEPKQSYREHFQRLKEIGYEDRVSIEAYTKNFEEDASKALKLLHSLVFR